MTQTTLKVKNGMIKLPKEIQKAWKQAAVLVRFSSDTVILKRVQPSSFWNTWKQMKSVGKGITKKDIDSAIVWARSQPTK